MSFTLILYLHIQTNYNFCYSTLYVSGLLGIAIKLSPIIMFRPLVMRRNILSVFSERYKRFFNLFTIFSNNELL